MTTTREANNLATAKQALADLVSALSLGDIQQKALSKKIACFAAAAVRADRVHRHTHDALIKLVDVLFNGRPA
jgi:predicted YcjX-like family ATPase